MICQGPAPLMPNVPMVLTPLVFPSINKEHIRRYMYQLFVDYLWAYEMLILSF